jgi:hypothetical protein
MMRDERSRWPISLRSPSRRRSGTLQYLDYDLKVLEAKLVYLPMVNTRTDLAGALGVASQVKIVPLG